ncbi:hypothetical protein BU26DRAFT_606868 [Trematosphaeria pertusa]|uniref:Uncharacterized protein n=1 Tax=Trematosphaeria pertusa TaxID=390896 RepID=A0A6A6IAY2_9PLEO|nr:uncharacterized protein BU26DRAFT_606868 [Trematosphaeria pertusa]KAF2246653.1 hypothetical protein BU26DRAFT_606868 [Trematosphaeria pertusa]
MPSTHPALIKLLPCAPIQPASRCFGSSIIPQIPSSKPPSNPTPIHEPAPFNLFAQIRASSRPVRYTIYTGFALLATAETTFWVNVIYAKYFASEEEQEKADQLLERVQLAVKGYRATWMKNYGDYWGANLWGL